MAITLTRAERRQLERDNAKRPRELQLVPREDWPLVPNEPGLQRVWRSREFVVQEFAAPAPALVRLSVSRTSMTPTGWAQGISWDELQAIKAQCGYPDRDAVEVYPREADVVNVANLRHLWVLREPLAFAWR